MNVSLNRRNRAVLRALLAGLGALALATAAWRFDAPPDLGWDAAVLPVAAFGLACLAAAAAIGTAWLAPALLAGLGLIAQACGLQLIDTDRYANYQHYSPWSALGGRAAWLLPVGLQWGVSLASLRGIPRRPLARDRDGLRILAVVGVLAFSAAVPTASLARYAAETALALIVTVGAILNLLAFASVLPAEPLARLRAWVTRRVTLGADAGGPGLWDRRLPWIAALAASLAAALFARFVLGGVPHIDDSVSNLFQARTYALGRLAVPAPPDSAAFQVQEILIHDGRWFGYGFPGWPAVLAIGVLAGAPWLVNPALAGIAVLLNHRLLMRGFGRGIANSATLLLATSPWALFMSAEMMGHPLALVLALAVLVLIERARHHAAPGHSLLAGAGLGALALTRPLDAAVIGAVALVWLALGTALPADSGPPAPAPARLRTLGWLGLGAAAVAALLPAFNQALTGDPGYTPQMMWTDRAWGPGSDRYGFGPDIGIRAWPGIDPLPGHGPADVVLNLNKNLFAAGVDLFGWAGASLFLVLVALAFAGRSRAARPPILLLGTCVAAYSGYWFAGGPDLGPRYWYLALPALLLLTVLGAHRLARSAGGERTALTLALATASALLTFVPWRAATRYFRFRDIGDEVRLLAKQNPLDDALVLVAGDREALQAAFNFQDPLLRQGRPVFARDPGDAASREALSRLFPGRPVWILGPGPGPDRRLRVQAGPLPASPPSR